MSPPRNMSGCMRRRRRGKFLLGITGGFASGKSTVARLFAGRNAAIINADSIAHECIEPGRPAYRKIVKSFGSGMLKENKAIDRRKLSRAVFAKKTLLLKLNRIVHPEVISVIEKRISRSPKGIIILDAPLLIEAGLRGLVDKVIVVEAGKEKQVKRAEKKLGLQRSEILSRIRAQIPLREKIRAADFTIDNNGTINQTRKQVAAIRRKLWKS